MEVELKSPRLFSKHYYIVLSSSLFIMKQFKFLATLLVAALSFASCIDVETPQLTPPTTGQNEGAFVLNQGNQNAKIAGSCSFYDWKENMLHNSVFSTANGRSLGEAPQDGVVYGSKLYVSLWGSNAVQVIDANSHKLIRTIATAQPQGVVAYGGHLYVANNTGQVSKIDTLDLQVKQQVEVGPNPVDVVVRDGMLYVSISDGYNYQKGYVNGKRLSKVNLANFRKEGEVMLQTTPTEGGNGENGQNQTVVEGVNPTQMVLAEDGNIFVVCMGDYAQIPARVWKVSKDDKTSVFAAGNIIATRKNELHIINKMVDWKTGNVSLTWNVYDTQSGKVVTENFAKENWPLDPIAMNVHPRTGRVLVTSHSVLDAKSKYTSAGYLYTYTGTGHLLNRQTVGVEPYAVVFR